MKRALILVEGQTEERFVKGVLAPAFDAHKLFFQPTILVIKRVKDGPNFKGGVTSYAKFRNDIRRLLQDSGAAVVTTLLDYYGLPADFPGMNTRPNAPPMTRVNHIEQSIREELGAPANFIPFLALHEFEAWLFASLDELPRTVMQPGGREAFAAIRQSVATPEDIDEGLMTAPSKRIQAIFPSYRKTLHGPLAVQRIGLDQIRASVRTLTRGFGRSSRVAERSRPPDRGPLPFQRRGLPVRHVRPRRFLGPILRVRARREGRGTRGRLLPRSRDRESRRRRCGSWRRWGSRRSIRGRPTGSRG